MFKIIARREFIQQIKRELENPPPRRATPPGYIRLTPGLCIEIQQRKRL